MPASSAIRATTQPTTHRGLSPCSAARQGGHRLPLVHTAPAAAGIPGTSPRRQAPSSKVYNPPLHPPLTAFRSRTASAAARIRAMRGPISGCFRSSASRRLSVAFLRPGGRPCTYECHEGWAHGGRLSAGNSCLTLRPALDREHACVPFGCFGIKANMCAACTPPPGSCGCRLAPCSSTAGSRPRGCRCTWARVRRVRPGRAWVRAGAVGAATRASWTALGSRLGTGTWTGLQCRAAPGSSTAGSSSSTTGSSSMRCHAHFAQAPTSMRSSRLYHRFLRW